MSLSVYSSTATKNPKTGKVFAFGRDKSLDGSDKSLGGYCVWTLCENYNGQVRGGVSKTWRYVQRDMSFEDAVKLMNRRVAHKAFTA
jgi:hypothetical protein